MSSVSNRTYTKNIYKWWIFHGYVRLSEGDYPSQDLINTLRGVPCMTLICSVLLGSFRPWAQQPILDWADRFMPLTPWCFCTKDGACFFSPGQHKICLVICSVTAGCFSLSRLVLDAPSQGARLQYCILHICVNISYIRIMLLLVFR